MLCRPNIAMDATCYHELSLLVLVVVMLLSLEQPGGKQLACLERTWKHSLQHDTCKQSACRYAVRCWMHACHMQVALGNSVSLRCSACVNRLASGWAGKACGSSHMRVALKVSPDKGCYDVCMQRRCYWLLEGDNGVVLVHYLSSHPAANCCVMRAPSLLAAPSAASTASLSALDAPPGAHAQVGLGFQLEHCHYGAACAAMCSVCS